ncbi:MAG: serine/threonine-protein kinase, partial [Acidobacteriota bacterium]|nr:serine/threonine-protein kinase [Acidobacteriota bacterium]
MPRCRSCDAEVTESSRFCAACGAAIAPATSSPTRTAHLGSTPSHPALDRARFAPGDLLADRYRIVALLGRGGMGEVYRADDLKLGQPVALKFLPADLEKDPTRLERFLNEVRIARQVSHPNVCRVYDVAETGEQHFISMEYIDGEDLASLLRRIGRLPEERAVKLARQICAGLAAAHQRGILHRDLKPANVMIDGRGHARITDFGLAGLAESFADDDIRAGTPAYMAPEQLDGREVTVRSDLYALGLVLYELFTGEQAFPTGSATQRKRARSTSTPPDPSSLVKGLDPAIERILLRCLDADPRKRPEGALAVAAALPGGDPLAAALEAGETPSPEMVAAAGGVGELRLGVGLALLSTVLLGMVGIVLSYGDRFLLGQIDLPYSAEALAFIARQIIEDAGYTDAPTDTAHGFVYDRARIRYAREHEPGEWSDLIRHHPGPAIFWYRQSPRFLVPIDFNEVMVTESDPQPTVEGMASVRLDPQGRLLRFHALPAPAAEAAIAEPDWSVLFERAGLDPDLMKPADPQWLPPDFCDRRVGWAGNFPEQPGVPVRVEACAYRGVPVWFELVLPWSQAPQTAAPPTVPMIELVSLAFLLFLLAGAVVLARTNVRLQRGDRRGAFRFACFTFATNGMIGLFLWNHVPAISETRFFFLMLAWGLMIGAMVWVVYLALEPYARRLWPDVMISWSRLLAGRLRDPLIGRDLLIGGAIAVAGVALLRLGTVLPRWLDLPIPEPSSEAVGGVTNGALVALDSVSHAIGFLFQLPQLVVVNALAGVFLLVLIRVIVRSPRVAVAVTFVLASVASLSV